MGNFSDIVEKHFFQQLIALPFVEGVYLFGSRARGDAAHDRVDVDLAVSAPNATTQEWQQVRDIIDDADTLLKIDCVRLEEAAEPFRHAIDKDRVVLYEVGRG